ncbi:CHASE2 domain-containing protein [Iningainema tapete]|uniref:CHASE2 domain-containing protein n=1 Tax=Iningainema tapete BLCC-T55 TaxID=2748662 RepID=A0A8J6XHD9_9CYAN|nr:CHASE2 domain-containing protein [Iningainema tapete BLCC-T55]
MDEANIYTVGGTVQAGGGIYISRQADEELLKLCRERVFAYVLTPRQMGKSSLMVRTAEKLAEEDIQSIIIDLTQLGVQVTAEQWYLGLLTIIEGVLMLDTDVVQWWQAHTHLGFTQRLTLFFQKVLLVEVASPVVIFVDEIDTTLSLNFTDDFFAAIRYFYVARSLEPEFRRLSFVLIGVATPSDLIRDAKRTPFNIGQRVDLTDFTFEEAKPLADGLGLPKDEAKQVLRWVLKWTGGHPYLTQRLCSIIREQGKSRWSKADVDSVVRSTFLGAMSKQDNNLQFVRDMLTKRAPDIEGVLTTYREICRGKRSVSDEEQSIVKSHLKLSGVVRLENARLCVRNPIYEKVFDDKWLKDILPVPFKRLTAQIVLLTSLVVTSLTMGIQRLGVLEPIELKAFDSMMQSRPEPEPDPRLLIVAFTESDIQKFKQSSPSGDVLDRVLGKLERYQPKVIGVDFFRDTPEDPGHQKLLNRIKQSSNIVPICRVGGDNIPAVPPPEGIKADYAGFVDIPEDPDGVIRRNLLVVSPDPKSSCATPASFGFQLAIQYLKIQPQFPADDILQLGKTTFKRLETDSGGYQNIDANGFQILLNYRSANNVAQQVSFADVLGDRFKPSWVKNRIVLIGSTAPSSQDIRNTPYSSGWQKNSGTMPGVMIHAQMVSQILDAVSDKRPLFWFWPVSGEFLWCWGWSLVASFLAWGIRNLRVLVLVEGSALGILYGLSFTIFTHSGWIPLIPPALALVVTSGSVVASHITLQKQQRLKISKSLIDKLEITCTLRGEQMTDVIARLITMYIEQNIPPTNSTDGRSKKSKN